MWWQTADGRLVELLRKDFHTDAAYYQALVRLKGFKAQGPRL